MQRIPKQGEIYNHFKDKLYQIIAVATHSETREQMVVYQALYGDFKTYVRPLDMFLSEVDREKYPDVKQKYRFELRRTQEGELVTVENNEDKNVIDTKISNNSNQPMNEVSTEIMIKAPVSSLHNEIEEDGVNSILMQFLEAKSYTKKLDVLTSNIKHLDNRLINDMAVSLDCSVDEGPLDIRIQGLISCLQAMRRFEDRRLR